MNNDRKPTVGIVIRFKNSSDTLPNVLESIKKQTHQPDLILGVDNDSTDGSREMIEEAGGKVVDWTDQYHHPTVLNFGVANCATDLVMVLSSHTVLESEEIIEHMYQAMLDEKMACVSLKWDDDPFYNDTVTWEEVQKKGLKFGSIYSNSIGMFRRSAWEDTPFDESLVSLEDYAWSIDQLSKGMKCKRLKFPFGYRRGGRKRHREFATITFIIAARHNLKVTWLGALGCIKGILTSLPLALFSSKQQDELHKYISLLFSRFAWRFCR